MIRRVNVRGVVLRDGKILCAKLKADEGSLRTKANDFWCLPGGGLEEGESLTDGITREMIEETGIAPVIGNLLFIQQFAQGEREFLELFFHITNAGDYLRIDLTKTSHGEREIAEIAFIDPAAERVLPAFLTSETLDTIKLANSPARIISYLDTSQH